MTPQTQAQLDQLNRKNAEFLARNPGARGTEHDTTWGFDDTTGAYYHVSAGGRKAGQRIYENTAMPGSNTQKPADTTSIFRARPRWSQEKGKWETPIDWTNIANLAIGTTLGANFIGALTAPAAAAPNAAAGAYIPGAEAGLPTALASENAVGITAPSFMSAAGAYIPGAEATLPGALVAENAMGPTPPPGGLTPGADWVHGTGIPSAASQFFKDPANYAKLAGLFTTLAARPGGGSGGGGGDLLNQSPQLQELLAMGSERAKRTDPLHQAVTQLAMSRLPTNMQR